MLCLGLQKYVSAVFHKFQNITQLCSANKEPYYANERKPVFKFLHSCIIAKSFNVFFT